MTDGGRAVRLEQAARATREIGDEEVVLVVLAHLPDIGSRKELHTDVGRGSGLLVARSCCGNRRLGLGHVPSLMSGTIRVEVDAEQLLADAEVIAGMQLDVGADAEERSVRRAEIDE